MMGCNGHADGTGTLDCTICGAPGCAHCFEHVKSSDYCTDCLLQRLDTVETEIVETERAAEVRDLCGDARRQIRRNWVLTSVAALLILIGTIGDIASDSTLSPLLKILAVPAMTIVLSYLFWAFLWGVPAAWKWWKSIFENASGAIFASEIGWIILAVAFFVIPLELGYFYGVFGGAVYEFRKAKRIAEDSVAAVAA